MPATINSLPDFKIESSGTISTACLKNNVTGFHQAVQFIKQLPYGRNADKTDLTTLFTDNCGTCSTKHAFLKQLATEHGVHSIQLVIGLYRMNAVNTPLAAKRLKAHAIEYIPEAHCYLKLNNKVYDFTMPEPGKLDFENDLLEETEITPEQITSYKISYHKKYIEGWLIDNPDLGFSPDKLWEIRELCIHDLSGS